MVTGCTGLICSAVVDVLIRWNETHEDKIKIGQRFTTFTKEDLFVFVPYDVSSTGNSLALPCDYIIHGASNAPTNKERIEKCIQSFDMAA